MIPFMTEEIYQNLVRTNDKTAPESIHLCDFPEVRAEWIDKRLEADMDEVLKIVVLGRAARNTANLKNRQPIGTMYVCSNVELAGDYRTIILDELNVKELVFRKDLSEFTSYTFKPQLKTVGPKYGKLLNGIRTHLTEMDGRKAMEELETTGSLSFDISGSNVVLSKEDLLIDMAQMEGYVTEADNRVTVVLDTNLSEALVEEGFVREIISKVQTMRKEADFEVMDKITVTYEGTEKAGKVFAGNAAVIGDETLAVSVEEKAPAGYVKEWKINGEKVTLGVERI